MSLGLAMRNNDGIHYAVDISKGHIAALEETAAKMDLPIKCRLPGAIDDELDVLYIDGDHSYEGVKKDIEIYTPSVRVGGYVLFHDYLGEEGVRLAIEEATGDTWEAFLFPFSCGVMMWRKKQ